MVGTLQKLYAEGGIPRFYRGLLPALIQVQLHFALGGNAQHKKKHFALLAVPVHLFENMQPVHSPTSC